MLVFSAAHPSMAYAHRMDTVYTLEPAGFRIEFFFMDDGLPAPDLTVTAQAEGSQPIALGATNEKGMITFKPPAPGAWTIIGKGGGHSNVRKPLVIPAEQVAAFFPGTPPTTSRLTSAPSNAPIHGIPAAAGCAPTGPPRTSSRVGSLPVAEIATSLGFILLLTLVTLWLMRRSAGPTHPARHQDDLTHELIELRRTVEALKRELDTLKTHEHT